jgi:hypothetical protein
MRDGTPRFRTSRIRWQKRGAFGLDVFDALDDRCQLVTGNLKQVDVRKNQ